MFIFCIDCTYLSVSRVNAIGDPENSKILPQLRPQLQCVSPSIYRFVRIQYHMILSSVLHRQIFAMLKGCLIVINKTTVMSSKSNSYRFLVLVKFV